MIEEKTQNAQRSETPNEDRASRAVFCASHERVDFRVECVRQGFEGGIRNFRGEDSGDDEEKGGPPKRLGVKIDEQRNGAQPKDELGAEIRLTLKGVRNPRQGKLESGPEFHHTLIATSCAPPPGVGRRKI